MTPSSVPPNLPRPRGLPPALRHRPGLPAARLPALQQTTPSSLHRTPPRSPVLYTCAALCHLHRR